MKPQAHVGKFFVSLVWVLSLSNKSAWYLINKPKVSYCGVCPRTIIGRLILPWSVLSDAPWETLSVKVWRQVVSLKNFSMPGWLRPKAVDIGHVDQGQAGTQLHRIEISRCSLAPAVPLALEEWCWAVGCSLALWYPYS